MATLDVNRKGFITGPNESSQSAARDASSGTASDSATGSEGNAIQYFYSTGRGSATHRYIRTFLHFDTSGISGGSSFVLQVTGVSNADANVIGVKHTAGEGTGGELANGDFDAIDFSTVYTDTTGWDTSQVDMTLSAAAATDIVNNDHFNIALVGIEDYNDTAEPLEEGGDISRGINFGAQLRLSYTAAASGYGHNVSNVAAANIGKVNTVATANIGKINTVD